MKPHPLALSVVFLAATLLGLFCSNPAPAQNVDPPTWDYRPYSLIARWSDTVRHTPQKFLLGWNFGIAPDPAQNRELRMNTAHGMSIEAIMALMPDSTRLIYLEPNTSSFSYNFIFPTCLGMAVQYDPVIDATPPQEFTPRYKDTSGAVWGFQNRIVGEVFGKPDTSNVNYNRMLLKNSDLVSYNGGTPAVVLSNPTGNNILFNDLWMHEALNLAKNTYGLTQLFMRDVYRSHNTILVPKPGHPDTLIALRPDLDTAFRGGDTTMFWLDGDGTSEWWLAVNLRRLNNSNYGTSDTVLSVRIPYVIEYDTSNANKHYDTLYAHFDSIAVAGNTYTHSTFGIMDNSLAVNTGNSTTFYITRSMLPIVTDTTSPDITLSAHFTLPDFYRNNRYNPPAGERLITPAYDINPLPDGILLPLLDSAGNRLGYTSPHPYSLIHEPLPNPPTLQKSGVAFVNMQVTYYGSADIGLDWLRFENRPTRLLLRGFKDAQLRKMEIWYAAMDSLWHLVQDHHFSIYRHYPFDECPAAYYRTQRYMNRFLENAVTTENGPDYPGQYLQQTEAKELWKSWFGFGPRHPAPYIKYGDGGYGDTAWNAPIFTVRTYRTQGLKFGYHGTRHGETQDSIAYTTYYHYDYETFRSHKDTPLYNAPDSLYRILMYECKDESFQGSLDYNLMTGIRASHTTLYDKNAVLWANIWSFINLGVATKAVPDSAHMHPTTAIFTYNRPKTGEELRLMIYLALIHGAKGILYYEGSSSFGIGDPFIGLTRQQIRSDHSEGGDFLDNKDNLWNYTDVDSVAHAMGIENRNRLYIGTKSMYNVVKHCNQWIDSNSNFLMRLQLHYTYNKGYKLFQSRRDTTLLIRHFLDAPAMDSITGGLTSLDPLPPSAFSVRRIHDRTGHAWTGTDEPFEDSTFFMVTLLKDTTVSMDTVFILSVLNRRTNPTLYYPASSPFGGGTNLGDSIKFFSTVEFDSLSHGIFLSGYSKPDYAQYGALNLMKKVEKFLCTAHAVTASLLRHRSQDRFCFENASAPCNQ